MMNVFGVFAILLAREVGGQQVGLVDERFNRFELLRVERHHGFGIFGDGIKAATK